LVAVWLWSRPEPPTAAGDPAGPME